MAQTPNDRLLKRTCVQNITGLGCSSIYALMQNSDPDARFPRPIKIGHRSRWSENAVLDWIARQKQRAADA
jgi:predicted DNA-binding transcriptional regulator AlpA